MKTIKKLYLVLLTVLGILLVVADQAAKKVAIRYLSNGASAPGIDGLFNFEYVENRGAAFGMLQDTRWFLVAITVLVIAALLFCVIKIPKKPFLMPVSVTLVVAGGVGNLIDRVFQGYVVDYIHLLFMDFPCFNIADICVCVGMMLLCISILLMPSKKQEAHNDGGNS